MARIARVVVPGCAHYVYQKGADTKGIFRDDDDRNYYIELFRELVESRKIKVLAYGLFEREVHFVFIPKTEEDLARTIGELQRRYARYYNANSKKKKKAGLFTGRFYSCPMDNKSAQAAICMLERTPVREGRMKKAVDCKWSSAKFNTGAKKVDSLMASNAFVNKNGKWKETLKADPEDMEVIFRKISTGRPCGDKRFIEKAEKITGRSLFVNSPGRPRKTEEETPAKKKKGKASK